MSYQPEERYWTDYLRVALPVVGLLLMLGLFLFWANQLINPDENSPTQAAVIVGDEGTEVIEAASPAATPTSAPDLAANPPANGAGAPTTPPDQNAAAPTATSAPADDAAGDQPADTNGETSADGGVAIDDTVRVTDDGVNLRSATSTESSDNIVGTLNEGDLVQIIGGPEEGESYTWYQVRLEEEDGTVVEGWVAGSFLEAT